MLIEIDAKGVLPTRVGVDRRRRYSISVSGCSPHTRGGGPVCSIKRPQFGGSPHTRVGGPTVTIKLGDAEYVLPTRVGVDR